MRLWDLQISCWLVGIWVAYGMAHSARGQSCDPGQSCSDNNACTTDDHCENGACVGTPVTCQEDANPCTTATCHPLLGCGFAFNHNPCDDGNPCTRNDVCSNGVCLGSPDPCSDENVCTTDSCDLATGLCVHANNTSSCNDFNACTVGDLCQNGACAGGSPRVCNDNKPCTDDTCNPSTGCVFTANDANVCSDNSSCTTDDHCVGGACLSTPCPLVIVSWTSVRTHITRGPQAIEFDPAKSGAGLTGPTVEPREGGIQRIEVTFDQDAVLAPDGASRVSIIGRTTDADGELGAPVAYSPQSVSLVNNRTLALVLVAPGTATVLPDRTCYTFDVSGVATAASGASLGEDTDCMVRVLQGDTRGDGGVNLSDAILTHSRISSPYDPRHDVNLDGSENVSDVQKIKSRITRPSLQSLCP
jgi:hypothetical protein